MKNTLLLSFFFLMTFTTFGQKAEFYIGGGGLSMPTATSKVEYDNTSSYYYISPDTITVNTTRHNVYNRDLVVKSKLTYSAGLYLKRNIGKKLELLYGIGGTYSTFNIDENILRVDETILKRDTIKALPSWYNSLGSGKRFVTTGGKETVLNGTNYTILALDLPLILRYNTRFQSFGLGIKASVPIRLSAYSEENDYTFVEETATERIYKIEKVSKTDYNPNTIARVGVHGVASYTAWMDSYFGLTIELQTQLNSLWNQKKLIDSYYKNYTETQYKLRPSSLSLKLHYRF
jgi:hypothetical protein